MAPFFKDGDLVYLKKVKFPQIKVDDFVSFKKNNCFVTHRVVYKTPFYLIAKGDNNLQTDGKIYAKDIFGAVDKIKRKNSFFYPADLCLFQSTYYFKEIN